MSCGNFAVNKLAENCVESGERSTTIRETVITK